MMSAPEPPHLRILHRRGPAFGWIAVVCTLPAVVPGLPTPPNRTSYAPTPIGAALNPPPLELYACTIPNALCCRYAWLPWPGGSTPVLNVHRTTNGLSARVPPGAWHCTSTIASTPDWYHRTISQ